MSEISDHRAVTGLFRRWGEVIHVRDADAAGVPRAVLRRQEARGAVIRVGKAAFVQRTPWGGADDWERFRLRAIGYAMCAAPGTFLTGPAAALLHGIPVEWPPPAEVTAIRPGDAHHAPLRSVHGRTRWGYLPLVHQMTRQRVGVTSPAYALVDIARHGTPLAGLMAADHLLHSGLQPEIPAAIASNMQAYPGIAAVTWALEHADMRCESPLETMGRYAFIAAGRPAPLSNVWIYDERGLRHRRVDHLIPEHGIVIEADGGVKYNNRPDAAEVVEDEKARHRWLAHRGFGIVRYNSKIATLRPNQILADVDREIAAHRRRPVPTCWGFEPPRSMTG